MRTFLIVLLSVGLSLIAGTFIGSSDEKSSKQETAFERVMRTGTIRCGYALAPPSILYKDTETGKLGGIFKEIIEQMASNLDLKVEWAEETGWGNVIESLQSKRFDVFCAPLWRNAERGRYVRFSTPLSFSASNAYVRHDDHRFDGDLNKLNDPKVKLATMDGEMSQVIARTHFTKAQEVSLPNLADISQLFLNVATGKADALFLEESTAQDFASKNPNKIRRLNSEPYQVFPNGLGVNLSEDELMTMLDSALLAMQNQGEIDRIIEKYEPNRSIFMPTAKPYLYIKPKDLP